MGLSLHIVVLCYIIMIGDCLYVGWCAIQVNSAIYPPWMTKCVSALG